MSQKTTKYKVWALKTLIHISAFFLLSRLYVLAFQDKLGGDPVEAVLHFTGIGAINLLLLTLLVSPLAKILKKPWLMQVRRLLGIYVFIYALCHLLSFLAFEVQFDGALFVKEVFQRPYITIGLVAFILLLALTLTSFNQIKRRMGKKWQFLHNFVYLIAILSVIHFYWSVKSDVIEPGLYIVMMSILLLLRKNKIMKWFRT